MTVSRPNASNRALHRALPWRIAPMLLAAAVGCPSAPKSEPQMSGAVAPGVRYVVGGDSRNDAAHVLPWAFHEAKARGAAAFLFLGDMDLTPQLTGHFEQELTRLDPIPFYPVLGNHEIKMFGFLPFGQAHAEKEFRRRFLDTARTPVESSLQGRVVYSVDLAGGVHFVALDNVSQNGFGKEQLAWLATDLDGAGHNPQVKHIIVGMHKPLARNGASTHGMDRDGAEAVLESEAALGLFVKARVALILASHVHEFASFTQGGIPSYITGGLGAPLDHGSADHAFHHLLVLDVADDAIRVTVVRWTGESSVAQEGSSGDDM
jgi:3',5'-cyclic AMP phosphodiesterase CpdA